MPGQPIKSASPLKIIQKNRFKQSSALEIRKKQSLMTLNSIKYHPSESNEDSESVLLSQESMLSSKNIESKT